MTEPLDLDAIKALDLESYFNSLLRTWYDGVVQRGDGAALVADLAARGLDVDALIAEVERLRETLGSCGGFLVTLRDTCDYDFTLAHEEQIGRLCLEIFHALHPQEPSDE
jgi:hypothetical protein